MTWVLHLKYEKKDDQMSCDQHKKYSTGVQKSIILYLIKPNQKFNVMYPDLGLHQREGVYYEPSVNIKILCSYFLLFRRRSFKLAPSSEIMTPVMKIGLCTHPRW